MNDQLREAILYGARKLKMDVSSAQAEQLSALLDRVLRYNQRINVIARCSSNEAVQRHIIDSLALLRMADRAPHLDEWVDVGSGGGFPGLVWAIMRPERSFLLVESISKKAALIKRHVFELGLKNVQVAPLRFEALPKPLTPVGMVSRATFAPDRWLQLATEFLTHGGAVLVTMGQDAHPDVLARATEVAYLTPETDGLGRTNVLVEVAAK